MALAEYNDDSLRPLPIVPPAREGETLGSWLARIGSTYGVSANQVLTHCAIASNGYQHWLTLHALPETQLRSLAAHLRTSLKQLRLMNASPLCVTGSVREVGGCLICLEQDIRSGSEPYWRQGWCCAYGVACDTHGTPLLPVVPARLHASSAPVTAMAALAKEATSNARYFTMARSLQLALRGRLSATGYESHYALDVTGIKHVVADLLEVLFLPRRYMKGGCAMMAIASLLDQDELVPSLSVLSMAKHLPLLRVKQLRARAFAMAVVHCLLVQSVSCAQPASARRWDALRCEWLPAFVRGNAGALLRRLARTWPAGYARQYWPDLVF